MRLVADLETEHWLAGFPARPDDFDWDEANRTKNLKHGVVPEDVEALFDALLLFAGRIVEPAHDEPRWLLLGQDAGGRRLALIFPRRGRKLRPISCRAMRIKERKLYDQSVASEEADQT